MDILLVCPRYGFEGYTPTSLASIASIAESLGHKVRIVDLNIEKMPKEDYDIVGITGLSLWKREIIDTANAFEDIPVILGGPWASLNPFDALSVPSIQYVCLGEGEETFGEFLEKYPNVKNVAGIGYKTENGIALNPRRPFIADLDSLPLPAWHLIKLERYRRVSIVTSRGCPYHCIFCSEHTLVGYKWRARSVSSVVEEIELLAKYGVKRIAFGDENMTLIPERFEEICEAIIEKGIKVEFDAVQGVRTDRLTPKLLELMKKAGFTGIIISPESGSQRVIDEVIHKELDLSVVEPVVKKCKEIGLPCSAFFVIGFPWETMEEIQQTVRFADHLRSIGLHSAFVGNALPFPDTELYAKAKAEGFLRFDGKELEQSLYYACMHDILYYLGKRRIVHCLTSPYWKPEDIIKICQNETKKDIRNYYKQHRYARLVLHEFIKHPIRTFKKALRVI